MTARLVFAIIFSLYLLFFTFHATYLGKTVYGDGIYYYAHLQSIFSDIGPIPNNKYSIGPALFWTPAYIVSKNELSVGFASVFYAITGLVLLFKLLLRNFSERVSLITILLVSFSTNLLFYGSIDPVNSHALSFFTVVLFLSFLSAKQKSWFAIGVSLGLVGIVRPQDMIVGFLVRRVKWRPFLSGLVLGFLPQMFAWFWLYGNPLALPYLANGEGFGFPHILGVLFAPSNGLFLWTPVTLLGLIGLWNRKNFLLIFLLQLLIVGSWSTWWQGASYSGRMFVGMLPLLAFGVAGVVSKTKIPNSALLLLSVSLLSVNMLLVVFFLIRT